MSVIKNGCVMRVIWLCYVSDKKCSILIVMWLCYVSNKKCCVLRVMWLCCVSDKERLCYESDMAVL